MYFNAKSYRWQTYLGYDWLAANLVRCPPHHARSTIPQTNGIPAYEHHHRKTHVHSSTTSTKKVNFRPPHTHEKKLLDIFISAMWAAVPDVPDLSSDSNYDEEWSNAEEDNLPSDVNSKASSSFGNSVIAPPSGVSEEHWQKFCKLKRRHEEAKSHNGSRKWKKQKKTDLPSKESAVTSSVSSSLLQLQGDELQTDPRPSDLPANVESPGSLQERAEGISPTKEQQEHWDTLRKRLDVNDHIYQGIDHGQYNPHKSGLEKQVEKAVSEGNFDKAEELSNQLATRDLACKIAKSADARDYLKWKEEEEVKRKAKRKKKKLNWGFEAKERWQMKGNM